MNYKNFSPAAFIAQSGKSVWDGLYFAFLLFSHVYTPYKEYSAEETTIQN